MDGIKTVRQAWRQFVAVYVCWETAPESSRLWFSNCLTDAHAAVVELERRARAKRRAS